MKEHKVEKRFTDLNAAMQQCFLVTGRQLEPLPPESVFSDFYVPSEDHHNHRVFPGRLTHGVTGYCLRTICYCFLEIFWALMDGDKVMMGGSPSPPTWENPES